MLIHFVCTGNSYRSRLAEAYLNAQAIPGLAAISSGIRAERNRHGPIVDTLVTPASATAPERETMLIRETERTFACITRRVDDLINQLMSRTLLPVSNTR